MLCFPPLGVENKGYQLKPKDVTATTLSFYSLSTKSLKKPTINSSFASLQLDNVDKTPVAFTNRSNLIINKQTELQRLLCNTYEQRIYLYTVVITFSFICASVMPSVPFLVSVGQTYDQHWWHFELIVVMQVKM